MEETQRTELEEFNTCQVAKHQDMESIFAENLMLDQTVSQLQTELKQSRELLLYEREHRKLMEKKAIYIAHCMKSSQRSNSSSLLQKNEEYQRQCRKLEEKLSNALMKIDELSYEKSELNEDLCETRHLLFECRVKLNEQDQLLKTSNKTENTRQSSVNSSNSINVANSMEKYQGRLETTCATIVQIEQQIFNQAEANINLKKKMQEFENDLQSLREAEKRTVVKVKELEDRILVMVRKCKNSTSQAHQLHESPLWGKQAERINERQAQTLLNSDLKQENEYLKSKITLLLEEMSNLKNEIKSKENLEKQLKEMEDALSEAKLDSQVATTKEQQSKSMLLILNERNEELSEKIKTVEEMVSLENEMKSNFSSLGNISKLRDEINCIKKLQADLINENEGVEKEVNEYVKENKNLDAELLNSKEAWIKYQKISGMLKPTCNEMEEDLAEFKNFIQRRDACIVEIRNDMKEALIHINELSAKLNSQSKLYSKYKHCGKSSVGN